MDMKKLLAVSAAVIGTAAVAEVSSSVVGYAKSDLDDNGGAVIVTPQFLGLGAGGAIDIQSINCGEDAAGLVFLNTLDGEGYTVDTYDWDYYKGTLCWVDESTGKPASNVAFEPGQAFWVQSDEPGNVFQSSGKVGTADVEVELDDAGGAVLCGNCSPVQIDIQSILCNEEAAGLVFLNTLDSEGYTVDTYDWDYYKGTLCWVDESTGKPADVTFEPGQAFWVQSDEPGNTITFPGVDL